MDGVSKWIVGVVLVTACAPAETAEQMQARIDQESASARSAIEANNAGWGRWSAAGQADSAAALFTEDGRTMYANTKAVIGRANILADLKRRWATRQPGTRTSVVTTEQVHANGPMAVEIGRAIGSYTPAKNAAPGTKAGVDTSKYVTIWHKVGDRWMVWADISNSDIAASPATPPAKPTTSRRR